MSQSAFTIRARSAQIEVENRDSCRRIPSTFC
jgi:hypothetical protein